MGTGKKGKIINKGKVIVLLLIISAALIFGFLFKDKLITSMLEKGMEKILSTDVEITELKAGIFSSNLTIGRLTAGNTEFRDINIDIDTKALLRKSFIIENISGTIYSFKAEENKSPDADKTGFEKEFPGLNLSAIIPDPGDFITSHLKDFEAFGAIEESKARISDSYNELKQDTEELRERTKKIKVSTGEITKTRITSADEGLKLLEQIASVSKEIRDAEREAAALKQSVEKKTAAAKSDKKIIEESINRDYGMIEGIIADPASAGKNFVSDYTAKLLEEKTGRYYPLIVKSVSILKNLASKESGEKSYSRGNGRTVYFPVTKLPRFLLKNAAFKTSDGSVRLSFSSLSTDPGLVPGPASFSVSFSSPPSEGKVNGSISFTADGNITVNADAELSDYSISNSRFACTYDADGTFTLKGNGELKGNSTLKIRDLVLSGTDDGALIPALNRMFKEQGESTAGIEFMAVKDTVSVKVSTSLDNLVSRAASKLAEKTASDLKEKADGEYKQLLSEKLDKWNDSYSGLKLEGLEAGEIIGNLKEYQKTLDLQKEKIKKEIAGFTGLNKLKLPF